MFYPWFILPIPVNFLLNQMKIENLANLPENELAGIEEALAKLNTLGQVLIWAVQKKSKPDFLPQIVAEVVPQDEFTNDVIIPYKDFFLVFDTT